MILSWLSFLEELGEMVANPENTVQDSVLKKNLVEVLAGFVVEEPYKPTPNLF